MGHEDLILLMLFIYIVGGVLMTICAWMAQQRKPTKKYQYTQEMVAPDYYKSVKKIKYEKVMQKVLLNLDKNRKSTRKLDV